MGKTAIQSNHTPADNATLFRELHKLETILFKAHKPDSWLYNTKKYLDPTLQALRRLHLEMYMAGYNKGKERIFSLNQLEKEVVKDIEDIVFVQNGLSENGDCLLFWWQLQDEEKFHEACRLAITKQL